MLLQMGPPLHGLPAWTEQVPPLQVSVPLQYKPSVQDAVLLGLLQPIPTVHMSSVQTLLSEQSPLLGVPLQVPPEQVSFWVQATASSQGRVLLG